MERRGESVHARMNGGIESREQVMVSRESRGQVRVSKEGNTTGFRERVSEEEEARDAPEGGGGSQNCVRLDLLAHLISSTISSSKLRYYDTI